MARRRARGLVAVAAAAAAVTLGACGREDFENEPRPPLPFDVSVELSDKEVVLSPAEFGAGIATFTIVNLTDEPAVLSIDGPTVDESDEIPAGATDVLKTEVKEGDYEARAEGSSATPFEFGSPPSARAPRTSCCCPRRRLCLCLEPRPRPRSRSCRGGRSRERSIASTPRLGGLDLLPPASARCAPP